MKNRSIWKVSSTYCINDIHADVFIIALCHVLIVVVQLLIHLIALSAHTMIPRHIQWQDRALKNIRSILIFFTYCTLLEKDMTQSFPNVHTTLQQLFLLKVDILSLKRNVKIHAYLPKSAVCIDPLNDNLSH